MESSSPTRNFRANRLTWFALVMLTLSTYFIAEQADWARMARPVIVFSMITKVLVIFFVFMEMRHAYWAWWLVGGIYSLGIGALFLGLL